MHRLLKGNYSRRAAIGFALSVTLLFIASALVRADSGSFNWETISINNGFGSITVERAPRLIYDPNAPGDSYQKNGLDWYADLTSEMVGTNGCSANYKCVPSVFEITFYITDTKPCFKCYWGNPWILQRWWPIQASEYGQTLSWTYSISGGGESFSGGISATVSQTLINQFTRDNNSYRYSGSTYRLGALSLDIAENVGLNSVHLEGGIRLVIRNANGPTYNNHPYQIWTYWHVSWRDCGPLACGGPEHWFSGNMYQGDSVGQGDGPIYLRTGTESGS